MVQFMVFVLWWVLSLELLELELLYWRNGEVTGSIENIDNIDILLNYLHALHAGQILISSSLTAMRRDYSRVTPVLATAPAHVSDVTRGFAAAAENSSSKFHCLA